MWPKWSSGNGQTNYSTQAVWMHCVQTLQSGKRGHGVANFLAPCQNVFNVQINKLYLIVGTIIQVHLTRLYAKLQMSVL